MAELTYSAYITIAEGGKMTLRKAIPRQEPDEITVEVVIKLPANTFKRKVPKVTVDMSNIHLIEMSSESAISVIAPEIARMLEVDVKTVQDGLLAFTKEKIEDHLEAGV